ncbi:MAG: 5'-3' exonuclease H3TH domain-containing protein, partial [Nitriliruptoraceae bacterium]
DDALASAAMQFAPTLDQIRILTPDKYLAQVVRGDWIIQVDRARGRVYNQAAVVEKFGVLPSSIPDYLALVGDTADGIPGIAGFGAKSTATILARYHHIDDIPTDSDDWDISVRGARRLADRLADEFNDALLYRDLATLRGDVPVGTPDDTAYSAAATKEFAHLCAQLGASRLLARLP